MSAPCSFCGEYRPDCSGREVGTRPPRGAHLTSSDGSFAADTGLVEANPFFQERCDPDGRDQRVPAQRDH